MEKNIESIKIHTEIWAYIISSLATFIWLFVSGISTANHPAILSNIQRYAIALILFCVLYLFTSTLLLKKCPETPLYSFLERDLTKRSAYTFTLLLSICGVLLIMLLQFNSVNTLGWLPTQSVTSLQWILIVFTCLILSRLAYRYNKALLISKSKRDVFWILSVIFTVVTILAAAYRNYLPNCYNDSYNWEAYWASAYAQYLGVPINPLTNSFYGYYSIVLYPFFKLVGFSVTTIAISTAIQGAFVAACACYAVWYISRKNNYIRLLGILATLYYSIRATTILYPQGPSRLAFTTALIAAAAWLLKEKEKRGAGFVKRGILLGYLIAMLGMMWSKDFGLFGIVAWTAFHIHLILSEHRFEEKDFYKLIYPITAMILTFVLAWQIISLLNVLIWNGSFLSLGLFMYPLGTGFAEALSTKLLVNWSPWVSVLLLLLFFFSKGIASTSIIKKSPVYDADISFGFMVSVLALGMLVYYINRTAYDNLNMSFYALVILLILLIKSHWNGISNEKKFSRRKSMKLAAFILEIFIISAFIVIGSMQIPLLSSKLSEYQNLNTLKTYTEEVKQNIVQNSIFLGSERTLWNLQAGISKDEINWSSPVNSTTESWENLQDIIKSQDHIVIIDNDQLGSINYWAMSTEDILKLYEETKKFTIGNRSYIILTPKNLLGKN